MTPRILPLAALALLTSLLVGCGDDNSTTLVPVVPTVQITELLPSVGSGWTHSETEPTPGPLVMPCDGQVAVAVTVTDFVMRPPGGCGENTSCGYAVVSTPIGPEMTVAEGGALFSPVLLKLDATFSGVATFTARLVHDDRTDYLDDQGLVVASTLDVTFEPASGCD